jgi:hypothetical protein
MMPVKHRLSVSEHASMRVEEHRGRFVSPLYKRATLSHDRVVSVAPGPAGATLVVDISGIYEVVWISIWCCVVVLSGWNWPEWQDSGSIAGGEFWLVSPPLRVPVSAVVSESTVLHHLAVKSMPLCAAGVSAVIDIDARPEMHHRRSVDEVKSDVAGAFKQLVGAHAPNIFKFMDFC